MPTKSSLSIFSIFAISLCWYIKRESWESRANLILLLEVYHWHKSNTEEGPGWNPEELHKKSFQNQIVCFQFLPKIFGQKGRTSSANLNDSETSWSAILYFMNFFANTGSFLQYVLVFRKVKQSSTHCKNFLNVFGCDVVF